MTAREEQVKSLLSSINIPRSEASKEESIFHERLSETAVDFLNILGYQPDNIFVNLQFETPRHVRFELGWGIIGFDAIAAKRVTAPPYVAIKTTIGSEEATNSQYEDPLRSWELQFLRGCAETSRARKTVLLSNAYLAIEYLEEETAVYRISELSEKNIKNIIKILSPPEELPEGRSGRFPPGYHPNQTKLTRWLFPDSEITPEYRSHIDAKFFQLDIEEYAERLYKAYTASTSVDKGESLEDVVEFLFSGLNLVRIRDRNLRTRTGEIDFVLEYLGSDEQNLFEYESRFVVVESKNVGESVSTKEVAHFEKKLAKSDVSIGILIAWNGISGEKSGDYAQRYVDSNKATEPTIVVLDSRDLYRILDGNSLYDLIEEKLYTLRFDL